jgi:hypothetical protein
VDRRSFVVLLVVDVEDTAIGDPVLALGGDLFSDSMVRSNIAQTPNNLYDIKASPID